MRVLVTGAAGFMGSHLVRHLLAEGHRVFAGTPEGVVPDPGLAGACWLPLDVRSDASVRGAVERSAPERVFHLAALSALGDAADAPLAAWEVNATATLRLLLALAPGTRFVFASSAQVYGRVPKDEQPIAETRPPRPDNAYAATKAAAEMAVVQATLSGRVEGVIARSFNSAGPGQHRRFALPSFARQLARIRAGEAEPLLRVGNLESRRDFVDIRDVARGYARLAEAGVPGAAYNVCSGHARSMREMLDVLVDLSGTGARVEVDPARMRPGEADLLAGDPSALRALGWRPEVPIERSLADLLEDETRALAAEAAEAAP